MEPEPTPPPQPLPIITEETRQRLYEDLGLTPERNQNPYDLMLSMTNQVFTDLITANKDFVQVTQEELEKVQLFPDATNSRIVGMAMVLRAFDINSNFDLIQRFGNLQTEDLNAVKDIIQRSLLANSTNVPILKRLLSMPRIPEQQITLNEAFRNLNSAGWFWKDYTMEGAATMYRILGNLWPKLYPQNNALPPQTPPTNP